MDREPITIPEVFRQAMEEYGWDEGNNNNGGGGDGNRRRPQFPMPSGYSWWLLPLVLFVLLFLSFDWIISTYADWIWFSELGYDSVWLKQWSVQILSFVLFFVISLLLLTLNWHLARRAVGALSRRGALNPLQTSSFKWLLNGIALVMTYLFASAASSQWEGLLRYFYSVEFGANEPIFGFDISFYLFELPIYSFLRSWLMGVLFITMAGVIAIYALNDWRRIQEEPLLLIQLQGLRRHLAILGALFLTLWALGYWLDSYQLLFSSNGIIFGAGHTDINASLLALRVQLVLMFLVALAVGYNAFTFNLRLPGIFVGLWLVAGFLLGSVYPFILQSYVVEPNELALETPYIEHNIELTRLAFGLDQIETQSFEVDKKLTQEDLDENEAALLNIRLWDPRPLKQTYAQLQELRPYYQFEDIDIDRYEIDGIARQVMLAGRELNKANLTSRSWVNERLQFTHGYGIVVNPVDRVTEEGQPDFFISDLPPRSTIDIEVTRPELYYGELTTDQVFVGSGLEEFDYPSGSENVLTSYEGQGGVPLTSSWRRLIFAAYFGDINVLLSEYITPETRVMYHRQIRERVQRITPFLTLDQDPYLVMAEGRLFWILDAYTLSNNFPYSTPATNGRFNYIRNSAKITVDAYNGSVNYYISAPDDPLILAYKLAFPDLFKPLSEMPASLQDHIRYPEDLFAVQTEQYLTYHMTNVQVFYNKEDLWEIPSELFDSSQVPVDPYYVIFSLPGESETEFLLIRPYVPRGKDNMIAWIAARNDVPHYGQLIAYELPKQELIFGPNQIESRIDQDPTISSQLSLWNQQGSGVIRGNLIVIPINDSFLYVEPLYLQSESSALPELKRVIVASPTRIIMGKTLEEALAALVDPSASPNVIVAEPASEEGTTSEGTSSEGTSESSDIAAPSPDASVEELIISANKHFQAAEEAQRAGDWSSYGRELEALQQELARLMELTGGVEVLPTE